MPHDRCAACALLVSTLALGTSPVFAQNYPHKPVRIVTAEAGGGNDFVARLIAPGLTRNLGQQVIVDNRTGMVSGSTVAKATPDGYTLLLSGSTLLLAPLLQEVAYDTVRDLSPVTLATISPNLLVVHPPLPAKSVTELIALARSRPGELNYGSAAPGATTHLSMELFKAMAAVDVVRINYKGTGPAIVALMGGQVQMMIAPAGSVMSHAKSGRLRALAVTTLQPSALFPELPTVAAAGLPGYESAAITGIFAPAGTPAPVITLLNREIVRVLNAPDIKERFLNSGTETVGSSPQRLAATVVSEMAKWRKVIADAGIAAKGP